MDADERRCDAVFLAEASFVVRGRYLVIAGNVIEGNLQKGDQIISTDPESAISGRTILSVETGSRVQGGRFIGLCIAKDTDSDIERLQSIQCEGMKIMIAAQE